MSIRRSLTRSGEFSICPDGQPRNGIRAMQTLKQFLASQDGVTSIEYALIASLIAIVIVAAVQGVGTQLSTAFTEVGNSLK